MRIICKEFLEVSKKTNEVIENRTKYLESHWVYEVRVTRKILGSGHI